MLRVLKISVGGMFVVGLLGLILLAAGAAEPNGGGLPPVGYLPLVLKPLPTPTPTATNTRPFGVVMGQLSGKTWVFAPYQCSGTLPHHNDQSYSL